MEYEMRQISDEGRREIAKELREQFYCCQYAEEFTEGLYVISEDAVGQTWRHPADGLYLNRPDSWKKLEEDLSNGAIGGEVLGMLPYCSYSGSEALACDKCRFGGDNRCVSNVFTDIRNRIRRMRGEL